MSDPSGRGFGQGGRESHVTGAARGSRGGPGVEPGRGRGGRAPPANRSRFRGRQRGGVGRGRGDGGFHGSVQGGRGRGRGGPFQFQVYRYNLLLPALVHGR